MMETLSPSILKTGVPVPLDLHALSTCRECESLFMVTMIAALLLESQDYFHLMVHPTGTVSAVSGWRPSRTASKASLK